MKKNPGVSFDGFGFETSINLIPRNQARKILRNQ